MQDEKEIIRQIQSWNKDLFINLYETYLQKIYEFIYFKVWTKNQAEDLTSETFLKAFKNISSYKIQEWKKFSSWLFTIANNIVIDYFRSHKPEYPLDELSIKYDTPDFVKNAEDKHKITEILKFLDELGAEKKEIFIMRIWNNIPYDEISQITGKTTNNCKQIFARTLKKIYEKFGVAAILIFMIR